MSGHRRCRQTGKVMFRTHAMAKSALGRCEVARVLKHRTYRMERSIYLCDHCDCWHLSSWPRSS